MEKNDSAWIRRRLSLRIEVSKYESWTPQTILERGMKMLHFMEERWNLEFKDEAAKQEFLFLDFME